MQNTDLNPEPLITIKEAADRIGVGYWLLQRAIKRGLMPSYAVFNSRRRVRMSDLEDFIRRSRQGGSK